MTFVVPGVAQYTIKGEFQSRAAENVICMRIDTTGTSVQRATAVSDMAGIVINEWCDTILPKLHALYTFKSVSWVDLDSEDGSVGARTVTAQETLPQPGGLAGAPMPANVALLVRKNVSGRRGVRKGRIYVAGQNETQTAVTVPNVIDSASLTSWQTAFNSWFGDMNQTDQGPLAYNARMCVAHILSRDPPSNPAKPWIPGNPRTGEPIEVSSLSVDQTLATQRRRLRG